MNQLKYLLICMLATVPLMVKAAPEDWRLQLLKEEGVSSDDASLKGLIGGGNPTEAVFLECVPQLGAEEFATREQAEKKVLRMGKAALPWLDRMPPSKDPEIRFRLARITKELALEREWTKDELVRYAAESLLKERDDPTYKVTGSMIFAELFRDEFNSIEGAYRGFNFRANEKFTANATGGVLRMIGKIPTEGDQQLVFDAAKIIGSETFPDSFQVEVMLGGGPEGAGIYHVGVSLGNVRVLFHPGYPGGGFRFESIDTHHAITSNADMGFTPKPNELHLMSIHLKRRETGNVELSVSVSARDCAKRFTTNTLIPEHVIGKVRAISLDRSGRAGGDGIYDNLIIRFPKK